MNEKINQSKKEQAKLQKEIKEREIEISKLFAQINKELNIEFEIKDEPVPIEKEIEPIGPISIQLKSKKHKSKIKGSQSIKESVEKSILQFPEFVKSNLTLEEEAKEEIPLDKNSTFSVDVVEEEDLLKSFVNYSSDLESEEKISIKKTDTPFNDIEEDDFLKSFARYSPDLESEEEISIKKTDTPFNDIEEDDFLKSFARYSSDSESEEKLPAKKVDSQPIQPIEVVIKKEEIKTFDKKPISSLRRCTELKGYLELLKKGREEISNIEQNTNNVLNDYLYEGKAPESLSEETLSKIEKLEKLIEIIKEKDSELGKTIEKEKQLDQLTRKLTYNFQSIQENLTDLEKLGILDWLNDIGILPDLIKDPKNINKMDLDNLSQCLSGMLDQLDKKALDENYYTQLELIIKYFSIAIKDYQDLSIMLDNFQNQEAFLKDIIDSAKMPGDLAEKILKEALTKESLGKSVNHILNSLSPNKQSGKSLEKEFLEEPFLETNISSEEVANKVNKKIEDNKEIITTFPLTSYSLEKNIMEGSKDIKKNLSSYLKNLSGQQKERFIALPLYPLNLIGETSNDSIANKLKTAVGHYATFIFDTETQSCYYFDSMGQSKYYATQIAPLLKSLTEQGINVVNLCPKKPVQEIGANSCATWYLHASQHICEQIQKEGSIDVENMSLWAKKNYKEIEQEHIKLCKEIAQEQSIILVDKKLEEPKIDNKAINESTDFSLDEKSKQNLQEFLIYYLAANQKHLNLTIDIEPIVKTLVENHLTTLLMLGKDSAWYICEEVCKLQNTRSQLNFNKELKKKNEQSFKEQLKYDVEQVANAIFSPRTSSPSFDLSSYRFELLNEHIDSFNKSKEIILELEREQKKFTLDIKDHIVNQMKEKSFDEKFLKALEVDSLEPYKNYWESKSPLPPWQLLATCLIDRSYEDGENYDIKDEVGNVLIHRPNHGVTHAIRQLLYLQKEIALVKEYGKEDFKNLNFTKEEIACAELAAFLFRSGRINESSGKGNPIHAKRSRAIFDLVALELGFNPELIKCVGEAIDNYTDEKLPNHGYKGEEQEKEDKAILMHKLIQISHGVDLVRCKSDYQDVTNNFEAKLGEILDTDIAQISDNFIEYAAQINALTGSPVKIPTSSLGLIQRYDPLLTQLCAHNVYACLNYLNDMVETPKLNLSNKLILTRPNVKEQLEQDEKKVSFENKPFSEMGIISPYRTARGDMVVKGEYVVEIVEGVECIRINACNMYSPLTKTTEKKQVLGIATNERNFRDILQTTDKNSYIVWATGKDDVSTVCIAAGRMRRAGLWAAKYRAEHGPKYNPQKYLESELRQTTEHSKNLLKQLEGVLSALPKSQSIEQLISTSNLITVLDSLQKTSENLKEAFLKNLRTTHTKEIKSQPLLKEQESLKLYQKIDDALNATLLYFEQLKNFIIEHHINDLSELENIKSKELQQFLSEKDPYHVMPKNIEEAKKNIMLTTEAGFYLQINEINKILKSNIDSLKDLPSIIEILKTTTDQKTLNEQLGKIEKITQSNFKIPSYTFEEIKKTLDDDSKKWSVQNPRVLSFLVPVSAFEDIAKNAITDDKKSGKNDFITSVDKRYEPHQFQLESRVVMNLRRQAIKGSLESYHYNPNLKTTHDQLDEGNIKDIRFMSQAIGQASPEEVLDKIWTAGEGFAAVEGVDLNERAKELSILHDTWQTLLNPSLAPNLFNNQDSMQLLLLRLINFISETLPADPKDVMEMLSEIKKNPFEELKEIKVQSKESLFKNILILMHQVEKSATEAKIQHVIMDIKMSQVSEIGQMADTDFGVYPFVQHFGDQSEKFKEIKLEQEGMQVKLGKKINQLFKKELNLEQAIPLLIKKDFELNYRYWKPSSSLDHKTIQEHVVAMGKALNILLDKNELKPEELKSAIFVCALFHEMEKVESIKQAKSAGRPDQPDNLTLNLLKRYAPFLAAACGLDITENKKLLDCLMMAIADNPFAKVSLENLDKEETIKTFIKKSLALGLTDEKEMQIFYQVAMSLHLANEHTGTPKKLDELSKPFAGIEQITNHQIKTVKKEQEQEKKLLIEQWESLDPENLTKELFNYHTTIYIGKDLAKGLIKNESYTNILRSLLKETQVEDEGYKLIAENVLKMAEKIDQLASPGNPQVLGILLINLFTQLDDLQKDISIGKTIFKHGAKTLSPAKHFENLIASACGLNIEKLTNDKRLLEVLKFAANHNTVIKNTESVDELIKKGVELGIVSKKLMKDFCTITALAALATSEDKLEETNYKQLIEQITQEKIEGYIFQEPNQEIVEKEEFLVDFNIIGQIQKNTDLSNEQIIRAFQLLAFNDFRNVEPAIIELLKKIDPLDDQKVKQALVKEGGNNNPSSIHGLTIAKLRQGKGQRLIVGLLKAETLLKQDKDKINLLVVELSNALQRELAHEKFLIEHHKLQQKYYKDHWTSPLINNWEDKLIQSRKLEKPLKQESNFNEQKNKGSYGNILSLLGIKVQENTTALTLLAVNQIKTYIQEEKYEELIEFMKQKNTSSLNLLSYTDTHQKNLLLFTLDKNDSKAFCILLHNSNNSNIHKEVKGTFIEKLASLIEKKQSIKDWLSFETKVDLSDVNIIIDEKNNTLLHLIAQKNPSEYLSLKNFLEKNGAKVDTTNEEGKTADQIHKENSESNSYINKEFNF